MQISICGTPGSGKSTVAKIIADKLNYRYFSVGAMRRKMAEKKGLTILEFNRLGEDTDTEFDNYQKELGKHEDNFVIEGRLSFHFVPKSIKFFFRTDPKKAAERIFMNQRGSETKYKTVQEALEYITERMENDEERYQKRYKLNPYDEKQFDYTIDTTNINVDEVVEKVMKILKWEKGRSSD